jgi:hypothetical protein
MCGLSLFSHPGCCPLASLCCMNACRCAGVKHKFVLGHNPTMATWEERDELCFAARKPKKKRYSTTDMLLRSGTGTGLLPDRDPLQEYTLKDKLSDIASIMGGLDQLTAQLNSTGV